MATIHKSLLAVLILMILISVPGCKDTGNVASSSAALSASVSAETDGYRAIYADKICDDDRDTLQGLCTEMCYRWAKMFYGESDRGFAHNGTIEGSFIDPWLSSMLSRLI